MVSQKKNRPRTRATDKYKSKTSVVRVVLNISSQESICEYDLSLADRFGCKAENVLETARCRRSENSEEWLKKFMHSFRNCVVRFLYGSTVPAGVNHLFYKNYEKCCKEKEVCSNLSTATFAYSF